MFRRLHCRFLSSTQSNIWLILTKLGDKGKTRFSFSLASLASLVALDAIFAARVDRGESPFDTLVSVDPHEDPTIYERVFECIEVLDEIIDVINSDSLPTIYFPVSSPIVILRSVSPWCAPAVCDADSTPDTVPRNRTPSPGAPPAIIPAIEFSCSIVYSPIVINNSSFADPACHQKLIEERRTSQRKLGLGSTVGLPLN
ncbi:hypothetical protein CDAR_617831 [Caerostris darwini]|uniref:Uncharacterized protein n=1 Tax=Caerostris darwini TaxID=1538125 RepID=A0AAV4WEC0_9ARAC|nr:hypothetical protein CDAR_617831 [Caerostris darwini]